MMRTVIIGGQQFIANQDVLSKSVIFRSTQEPCVIDRNPAVFPHILDWMREGRLYLNCPSDEVYKRLCADAEFYELDDLRRFLNNRVNLCSGVYLEALDGRYFFNVDGFRSIEESYSILDDIVNGEYLFASPDTIPVNANLALYARVLLTPQEEHRIFGSVDDADRILGRCAEYYPGFYRYLPSQRV